jgi:tRNA A-37 threonylcarbamoyl transferase component Bud32
VKPTLGPPPERFLEDADRAERAGELAAAAVALRGHLERHPEDRPSRLRFARLLAASGEQAAARAALTPLEANDADDPLTREATRRLAELDEAEGAALAATTRWERLLADDIDDPQARAHLARLQPGAAPALVDPSQTLVSPEGVETSRYQLLRELGRGATATVYLARDVGLDLPVALKVLHAQLAGAARSAARRRFFAEARLAAAIRHPGVVAIYDVDEEARALAMEHIAGGTLRERLRASPDGMPGDELDATGRSLLGALRFVHERGIVHGDLKPSNLLLRRPGEVVLADFGAAELAAGPAPSSPGAAPAPAGTSWAPGGTPLYLAPEQFQGAPASRATDLYATGAILWEATTGRALRSHTDLVRGSRRDRPAPDEIANVTARAPAWTARIARLLSADPASRVSAAG